MRTGILASALAVAAFVAGVGPASAQTYPERPVTMVVPYSAGGATDIMARLVAQGLSDMWPQPVVIENRPGGGTSVALDYVARAEPDGHTISIITTSYFIGAAIRTDLPYDPLNDLVPVSRVGSSDVVLLAYPGFEADTVEELVELAKEAPGMIAYASPGVGGSNHMAGELLQEVAGIELLHTPYPGGAQGQIDVMGGRVPLIFDLWHAVKPLVESGELKVLGVATSDPIPDAPDLPLIKDIFPDFEIVSLQGFVTTAGTPPEVVEQISAAIQQVVLEGDIAERLRELGVNPGGSSPEEFLQTTIEEIEKWRRIAEAANITIN